MKWIMSGLMCMVFLIAAWVILSPLMSPVTNITYTYSDGSAQVIEYVDFDVRGEGIAVLWVGDNAILCERYGQHAHCKVGLPVGEVSPMRVELVEK